MRIPIDLTKSPEEIDIEFMALKTIQLDECHERGNRDEWWCFKIIGIDYSTEFMIKKKKPLPITTAFLGFIDIPILKIRRTKYGFSTNTIAVPDQLTIQQKHVSGKDIDNRVVTFTLAADVMVHLREIANRASDRYKLDLDRLRRTQITSGFIAPIESGVAMEEPADQVAYDEHGLG